MSLVLEVEGGGNVEGVSSGKMERSIPVCDTQTPTISTSMLYVKKEPNMDDVYGSYMKLETTMGDTPSYVKKESTAGATIDMIEPFIDKIDTQSVKMDPSMDDMKLADIGLPSTKDMPCIKEELCLNENLGAGGPYLCNNDVVSIKEEVRSNTLDASDMLNICSDSCDPDKKMYNCMVCPATFPYNTSLTTHTRSHTGEKPHKCSVCEAAFSQSGNLQIHMRYHTGDKPYKCSICEAAFAQRGHLTTHMHIHTGHKPYLCSFCAAKLSRRGHLASHMKTHTREKPYKCSVCEATFSHRNSVTVHMRHHTGERPYKCTVCEAVFSQSGNLQIHMRNHTGYKPYKCSICEATFGQMGCLTAHMLVHRGEKPYKCSLCPAMYVRNDNLTRHRKKKHKFTPETSVNMASSMDDMNAPFTDMGLPLTKDIPCVSEELGSDEALEEGE